MPVRLLTWLTSTQLCTSHGWCLPLPVAVGLTISVGMATTYFLFCVCVPAGAPPGSLGLPFIGESLHVIFNFPVWLAHRTSRYGPVFVSYLFFHPTVVVMPTAANVAWFIRAEADGQLCRFWPRALQSIFGSCGLMSQASGPERNRVRAAVQEHLCGTNVLGMVSPLASLVRRRVKRWRRLSGTLEGRKGRRSRGEVAGGKSAVPDHMSSSSPRGIMSADGVAVATDVSAVDSPSPAQAVSDVPVGDGDGCPPVQSSPVTEPLVRSSARRQRSWTEHLFPWLWGAPPEEPSFPFLEEARSLMAALIVHVVFGEDTLGSTQRKHLCEQVSLLVGGVNAVCPFPFFGLTAVEKAAAARAELTAIVHGLIVKRRREVDAFRDRPVCLLDSIIGWVDEAGHILPSDVQVDYALEQILVALISLPLMLNAVVFYIAQPARWEAIRDQCEAEKVFDHRGIDALRLPRATLLERAIFESAHQMPPGRGTLRVVRQSHVRLGPYELPRGWMVMMLFQHCRKDEGDPRMDGINGTVGEGLTSDSGRSCPRQNDGPSRRLWPSAESIPDGSTATAAGSRTWSAASSSGTTSGGSIAESSPSTTVPHPSSWVIMGYGEKACPAAETAVLLVKLVCLVLLQETHLQVVPGATARHGMLPLTYFDVRVHKR